MSRLAPFSPWAARALGDDDRRVLEERAEHLGVTVTAGGGSPVGPWTVHVNGGSIHEATYAAKGPLAVAINGTLNRWAEQKAAVEADLERIGFPQWTPEEILQIAVQSGIEVRR